MDPVVMAAEQQIDGRPATGRRHDDDHRRPAWATAGTISPPQGRTPVDQVLGMSLPSAAGWSAHPAGAATREQRRHTTSSHRPGRQARGVTPRREGPTAQSPGHGTRFPGQLAEPVRPTQATLCCCWSAHGPAGLVAGVGAENSCSPMQPGHIRGSGRRGRSSARRSRQPVSGWVSWRSGRAGFWHGTAPGGGYLSAGQVQGASPATSTELQQFIDAVDSSSGGEHLDRDDQRSTDTRLAFLVSRRLGRSVGAWDPA